MEGFMFKMRLGGLGAGGGKKTKKRGWTRGDGVKDRGRVDGVRGGEGSRGVWLRDGGERTASLPSQHQRAPPVAAKAQVG